MKGFQLNEGFKRSVYQNQCKTEIKSRKLDDNNPLRILLDTYFQEVKRLFIFAFKNTDDDANRVVRKSHRKHSLPRVNIGNYDVLIDGRNFYDQSINDQIKKYEEVRKMDRTMK